jgi:hypothetical protein
MLTKNKKYPLPTIADTCFAMLLNSNKREAFEAKLRYLKKAILK